MYVHVGLRVSGNTQVRQNELRPHLKAFNPPSGARKDGTEVNMYQNGGRGLGLLEKGTRAWLNMSVWRRPGPIPNTAL